ncbi:thioredoxin domain-containing protein [Spongorhabdus nitratireducens]
MSRIIKCWVSGLLLVMAGYQGAAWGAFREGVDYDVLDPPCTDHSLVADARAVGKVSVLKFYSLTCIPCFQVEDELRSDTWQDLGKRIQLTTVHRVREEPSATPAAVKKYNEWDYPFVTYHYALEQIADEQRWEAHVLYDTLKLIHQQLMVSSAERKRLGDTGAMATFLKQKNIPGFKFQQFGDSALDDDFWAENIQSMAVDLSCKVQIASIPAFVVGGKYKVERSKHITEKIDMTPADITKMLKIVEHLVGMVQAETS